jgi:hypothetical protein
MLPPLLRMHVDLTSWTHQNERFYDITHSGDRGTLHVRIHDASEWLTSLLVLPGTVI